MNILVNASNLKVGGSLQVADSFIRSLPVYSKHNFTVVVPNALSYLADEVQADNINYEFYTMPRTLRGLLIGRNKRLDSFVEKYSINMVFTIFAPTLWKSNVTQVAGYAYPLPIYPESPFFSQMSFLKHFKIRLADAFRLHNVRLCNQIFITENPDVSARLSRLVPGSIIHTVSNCPHDIYKNPEKWKKNILLDHFDGTTLLYICANYPHKNLSFLIAVTYWLRKNKPHFSFRFVLTLPECTIEVPLEIKRNFVFLGTVDINQCPGLYQQSDIVFMPTLLECFSAGFVESMIMRKPLIVSNLGFATGLCGDAAFYINPISAESAGNAIFKLAHDKCLADEFIRRGENCLSRFGTAEDRAKHYIEILEQSYVYTK